MLLFSSLLIDIVFFNSFRVSLSTLECLLGFVDSYPLVDSARSPLKAYLLGIGSFAGSWSSLPRWSSRLGRLGSSFCPFYTFSRWRTFRGASARRGAFCRGSRARNSCSASASGWQRLRRWGTGGRLRSRLHGRLRGRLGTLTRRHRKGRVWNLGIASI
jgi:hypothetical protein